MITEDYVSFETAKLLKEKGFDWECIATYNLVTGTFEVEEIYQDWTTRWEAYVSAPTLQMAMKWLREVHNLHIEVYRTACGYLYIISKIPTGSDLYDNGDAYDGDDENSGQWTTNEKACEAAIKYCLENLV